MRLTRAGAYDTSFGNYDSTHGTSRINFTWCNPSSCVGASNDYAYSLAEWGDGSGNYYIYQAGSTDADGSTGFAVARYNLANGSRDTGWGFWDSAHDHQTGQLIPRAGVANGIVMPGGMLGNGKFVLSGVYSGTGEFYVDSYNSDGSTYDGFAGGTSDEESGTFGGTTVTALDSLNVAPSGNIEISGVNPTACSYDIGLAEYSFS